MVVACMSSAPAPPASHGVPLVYGADDRREVAELVGAPALYAAARATAAIIPRARIRYAADGAAQIAAASLAEAEGVCADEAYAQQPSAAECTAVLIDDNLIATAGHCFRHAWDCENYLFVFGYALDAEHVLEPLDVYECRRAWVQESDLPGGTRVLDYAIVELTEHVRERTPVAVREAPLSLAEPLTVVSATSGLPLKSDEGGRVLDARAEIGDYFVLESDTFHGSSGAPVLDARGALLGLFARGNNDYTLDEDAGCYRVSRRPSMPTLVESATDRPAEGDTNGGIPVELEAEHASYVLPAIVALCAGGYPSVRLCGIEPVCGDGVCGPDEASAPCPHDCGALETARKDAGTSPRRPSPDEDAAVPAVAAGPDAGAAPPARPGSEPEAPPQRSNESSSRQERAEQGDGCSAGARRDAQDGWLFLFTTLFAMRAGSAKRREASQGADAAAARSSAQSAVLPAGLCDRNAVRQT